MSTYSSLEELPRDSRRAVEGLLENGEAFLGGIDCNDAFVLRGRRSTKLLLTDRRVVEYRRRFIRGRTTAYDRDQVTTASVSMGLLYHQLILAGPGLRRTVRVDSVAGRQFADALRSEDATRIDDAGRYQRLIDARDVSYGEEDGAPAAATTDHWPYWHYVLIAGTALALVGAFQGSLALLGTGYLSIPITLYLDMRFVEDSDVRWQPDVGLYLVGGIIFPLIAMPMYLYRRHETVGL